MSGGLKGGADGSYDCNGTDAQMFSFARGNGAIYVSGTNYCLDSGLSESTLTSWTTAGQRAH